jgi:hypothetical protein
MKLLGRGNAFHLINLAQRLLPPEFLNPRADACRNLLELQGVRYTVSEHLEKGATCLRDKFTRGEGMRESPTRSASALHASGLVFGGGLPFEFQAEPAWSLASSPMEQRSALERCTFELFQSQSFWHALQQHTAITAALARFRTLWHGYAWFSYKLYY